MSDEMSLVAFDCQCDMDEWREVINGPNTYKWIVNALKCDGSAIIGWTDEQGTHFDILFSVPVMCNGNLQGGLNPGGDLFVSLMRIGAFSFDTRPGETHHHYIAEKLGLSPSVTTEALAQLINNVRREYVIS
jgi:hypothetical protein